jgi:hypothetical protein
MLYSQSSPLQVARETIQNDPTMTQDVPLLDFDIRRSISQLRENHLPCDMAYTELGEASRTIFEHCSKVTNPDGAVTRIGSLLNNGKFICEDEKCAGLTFARQAELRRHHTTIHDPNRPNFWCPVSSCRYSMSAGGQAFHRKDKLMAHVRTMHADAQ